MTDAKDRAATSSRFERFLEDVPKFIAGLFVTPYRLFREPENLAGSVRGEGLMAKGALPPLTYLFVCSALAWLPLRAFTDAGVDFARIFPTILEAPVGDFGGLFTIALPMALAILFWCYLVDALVVRQSEGRHQRAAFLSYAPAALLLAVCVAYFALALFNVAVGARVPEDLDATESKIYWLGGRALAVLILTMGVVLGRRAADGLQTFVKSRRLEKWRTVFALALPLGVVFSMCFSFFLNYLVIYATAPRGPVRPVTIVEREFKSAEDRVEINLKVLLESWLRVDCTIVDLGYGSPIEPHKMNQRVIANWPQLAWGYGPPVAPNVTRMALVDSPFLKIPARGRAWVRLRGTLDQQAMNELTWFAEQPGGVVTLTLPCVTGTKPGRPLNFFHQEVSIQFMTPQ